MSSEDEIPAFVKDPEHKFVTGEKIYVIDENGFDIYAAELRTVTENSWEVHYPQYAEDDFTAKDTTRFLVINEENKKIFEEQESIRKCKDLEEEDEDESGEPDDPEDGDASENDE